MSDKLLPPARRRRHRVLTGATIIPIAALIGTSLVLPAQASTVTSATFTGGAGTVTSGGTLYAKQNATPTLTINTSSDTKCVDVAGALIAHQQSSTAKSTWTFATTAGAGDGAQAVTATASPSFNTNDKCTGSSASLQASYTLDNTGPVVTGALAPAPNAAGWNKSNVGISWSASDSGSGVGSGPTPAADTVSIDTGGLTKTATATDRLGNTGSGSVLVKLDKTNPTISSIRTPGPNVAGWNNSDVTVTLACSDPLSGIKSCTGGGTVVVSTQGANQSVNGSAVDNADNAASGGVTGINIDKTAPSLSGAPTTAANSFGWYNGDVAIAWTAADSLSGLANGTPANSTITGEGSGLKDITSVSDKAGNTTTADSAAVNIDRAAPTTGISGTSNNWTNGDVTVSLSPSDNLSGVGSTSYAVDGGATQTGTSFTLSSEGDHTVTFFSTDKAGNTEAARTAHVKIDKTAPTIGHSFTPLSYSDGAWTNQNVTVTFDCADTGSGVATCSAPVTKSTEGAAQQVTGSATDNAGNSASNTAAVSIDKTMPTITAAPDRAANAAGWYNDDVTVSFTAGDSLSGVANVSPPKVLGEGTDQSASGSATDAAGNVATAQVTGINVDKTAPVLNGSFSTGWHTDDVVVTWSCTDARSGVAVAPKDDAVTGEGSNLSSTATCTDKAGNTATKTVSGIKIDRTAPSTTVAVPAPLESGWYADAVKVKLTGHDTLSGIGATYYRVDNGEVKLYDGEFDFATKGEHTISYWSKDAAGNTENAAGNSITLKIDGIAPSTAVINPISPASGWFVTSGIPVAFKATDAESGIGATYYQIDGGDQQTYGEQFTADLSTGNHTITYWSVDLAGNAEAKKTTEVKVDTVPPVITGSRTPAANTYGWTNTDVNVSFTCTDAGSGLAAVDCGPNAKVSDEGAGQKVVGTTQDVAGNTNSATVDNIDIDKTAPSLTGAPTTPANGAGWYKSDVKVHWTGTDTLAGIDPLTQPDDSTVVGEGNNLGASAEISDKAGNKGTGSVSEVKIDRTAPVVTGAPTTNPNGDGWYRGQVVVDFKCADNLSGVAVCPTSKSISTDGANQSVTSDPATDVAGNDSAGKTVGGINIDSKAPSTVANNKCTAVNDWCTGATADVVLTATDQAGLSGVKEVHYKVDGGDEQVAAGATKTVTVPLDGSGKAAVTYWSVDKAGNVEAQNSVALKWDNIAPTVTHTVAPTPNADGWNKSDTTVTFNATDDDKGSGVATVTKPVTVDTETAGQDVDGSATDTAGNVGTDKVTVKLDKTAPSITGAIVSGTTGNNGWYVGPVKVHFTCNDNLSGLVTCTDDVTLTDNGTNSASGTATDKAGNSATTTVSGIKIDQTRPTTSAVVAEQPESGWYAEAVLVTLTGHDQVSGVAGTYYRVDDGEAQLYDRAFNFDTVGTHTITYWSVDVAGNVENAGSNGITLSVDTVAPGIEGARTPDANKHGWNNTNVDVTFICRDSDSDIAGCSPRTIVSNEGAGQKVVGDAQDVAGNKSSATVDKINIDKTAPGLTGVATTTPNAGGWYKGDVQIKWNGTDGLSSIDPATQPNNSTITGEGDNLGATASISDKAGNETTASVSGVKIDRTAPVVTGAPTTNPNEDGWYRDQVKVDFKCTDNLSGVAACPTSKVVAGNGANQSVSSDPATDNAGNDSAGTTVGGINIDGSAPSTTANNQCTKLNGWCTGDTADVVLTATDQAALAGVKEIHYKVDGGAEQVAAGSTKTVTVPLNGSGEGTVTYWSVDKAGNVETASAVALKWDNIAPTVTHTLSPAANANGWNKSNTTVTFTAKDDDAGSDVANVTEPVTVSTETTGQVVEGSATDTAGNVGKDSVTVKLDKTAPSITGAIVSGDMGSNGWYVGPVKVHFTCADALSGIAICPDDVTLNDNGTNSASGTATDNAGNTATATVSGIKIDRELPTITSVNVANGFYTLGAVPAATCTASDSFSGLAASCTVTVTGGTPNGVGTFTYTATAVDNAGNTNTATGTYKVVYRFDGFLQPINDTAHQVGSSTSVFKAGSTVPVKLQLKKSNGTVVQTNATPVWLTPVKGSAMSLPVDESLYTASADSGSTYRYDSSAQQYIYNWKTPNTGGSYYRIGVTLDDGQSYYVNIGLRN
ncbi:PxKF domain-containing protein [Kribbella sp. NPDC023972]|uniref:OmpL47-type beta-barrel domain-containing protein n=1 Tax=Kribbella sp. NPDC023972 TaxID=3154795 RepID=UPI0033F5835A